MFDRLVWTPDRMLLDDLVFRLQHYRSDDWDNSDHFLFYKIKELVDQYRAFFELRSELRSEHVFELGIFDGGSTAFWHELLQPRKHVAVDILDRGDTPYFSRYVESRGLSGRLATFWSTDQSDKTRLREIATTELDGPLNLVIDDASHLYGPTKASFETLFPLIAPGGWYIIEDWAWGHWSEFIAPDHPWATEEPLTKLVIELIEATGTSTQLIGSVVTYQGFVAVERGLQHFDDPATFELDRHIVRRPSADPRR